MTPATIRVDIGEEAYTLNFNFGTMRTAEKEIGQPLMSIFQKDDSGNVAVTFDAISALWWASLQRKHRMTRERCDALVDEAGFEKVTAWVTEGLAAYFGTDAAVEAGDDGDDGDEGKGKRRKA